MKYAPKIEQNISKFYLCAFFDKWAFATGILVFHYRELGFSFFQIFLISVVYEFLNFILEIPTGALADLWSYKKTITIGYFISGMNFFIVFNPARSLSNLSGLGSAFCNLHDLKLRFCFRLHL
jgi:MFS family permease